MSTDSNLRSAKETRFLTIYTEEGRRALRSAFIPLVSWFRSTVIFTFALWAIGISVFKALRPSRKQLYAMAVVAMSVGIAGDALYAAEQSRPILHLAQRAGSNDQFTFVAGSSEDGTLRFSLPGFCEGAWSPQVDTLACNTRDSIFLSDSAGRFRKLAQAEAGTIFFWNPAWSPDGARIAILSMRLAKSAGKDDWSVQLLNAASGKIESTFGLPEEPATAIPIMGGYPLTMISPDKIAWSPDGQRILVSWGYATLIEIGSGRATLLSPNPVFADWDSVGALWFVEIEYRGPNRSISGLFQLDPATVQRRTIAPKDSFEANRLGLGFSYTRLVISPSGMRMALAMLKTTEPERDLILIYDITDHSMFDLSKPLQTIQSDTILLVDWSPNEQQLAVSHIDFSAASKSVSTDVIDLTTQKTTGLSKIPVSNMQQVEGLAFLRHLAWTH